MQIAFRRVAAQGVEHKHWNIDVKFFTIFSDTKITAVHGAGGCAQAGSAGVFELFAGFQERLVADYAQASNFSCMPSASLTFQVREISCAGMVPVLVMVMVYANT